MKKEVPLLLKWKLKKFKCDVCKDMQKKNGLMVKALDCICRKQN